MNKKVAFGTQPSSAPATLDELVKSRAETAVSAPLAEPPAAEKEATRRISVDLPISLHTKLKLHCVQNGILMADYVRDLLAGEFKDS